jgi:hypothetical protein
MGNLIIILLLIAPIAIFVAVMRNRGVQRKVRASTVELRVDEFGVHRELADGRIEEIDWGEVREVSVLVTNKGPHADSGGVIVLWGDLERGCLVPIDRSVDSGLIEALPRLPGFDSQALVEALALPPVSQTVVWTKDG